MNTFKTLLFGCSRVQNLCETVAHSSPVVCVVSIKEVGYGLEKKAFGFYWSGSSSSSSSSSSTTSTSKIKLKKDQGLAPLHWNDHRALNSL